MTTYVAAVVEPTRSKSDQQELDARKKKDAAAQSGKKGKAAVVESEEEIERRQQLEAQAAVRARVAALITQVSCSDLFIFPEKKIIC